MAGRGARRGCGGPGNLGATVWTRELGDVVEVTTVSYWESMAAVTAFAGDDPQVARFYPGDDDLLAETDEIARHYEVLSSDLP